MAGGENKTDNFVFAPTGIRISNDRGEDTNVEHLIVTHSTVSKLH